MFTVEPMSKPRPEVSHVAVSGLDAINYHHLEAKNLWRNLSLFVVVPILIVMAYRTYKFEMEHHGNHPEDQPAYHYLRIRRKVTCILCSFFQIFISLQPFPWKDGDTGLFETKHEH